MTRRRRVIGFWETIAVATGIAVLSAIAAIPRTTTETVTGFTDGTTAGGAGSGTAGEVTGGTAGTDGSVSGAGGTGSNLTCARNGGATDVGVTGTSIKLGATVVDTGLGAAFLSDVRYGMQAVLNQVNASGGICGRRLDLLLRDDGWSPERGRFFIENLVQSEKVFALAVVPSSEGLRASGEYLKSNGVPVVGTDGMLISQYTNPMIWPVATSTITAMNIMAKHAWDSGARNFAMVYDSNFRFGVEGAFAFNEAYKRLTGGRSIPGYSNPLTSPRCKGRFCGIKAGQPSYQTEVEIARSSCGAAPACDYIVYLLEPETAQTWMRGGGMQASNGVAVGGPQPLFNRGFGVNCAQKCHGMWVWTGYTPPVGSFASEPAVSAYVSALRRTNAQADLNNSFVQGGYVGMRLLVEAIRRVGPNLTRARLIRELDSMRFESGLTKRLSWSKGDHFANQCMLGFEIQSKPSFAGWRKRTDWVCDPWPGQGIPASEH